MYIFAKHIDECFVKLVPERVGVWRVWLLYFGARGLGKYGFRYGVSEVQWRYSNDFEDEDCSFWCRGLNWTRTGCTYKRLEMILNDFELRNCDEHWLDMLRLGYKCSYFTKHMNEKIKQSMLTQSLKFKFTRSPYPNHVSNTQFHFGCGTVLWPCKLRPCPSMLSMYLRVSNKL